ncbi:hypothetical protein [Streptomyces sp. NPDC050528]
MAFTYDAEQTAGQAGRQAGRQAGHGRPLTPAESPYYFRRNQ